MNREHPDGFKRVSQNIRALALGSVFVFCAMLTSCSRRTEPAVQPVEKSVAPIVEPADAAPMPKGGPSASDPQATEARAKIIRRDADAILAECRKAADGDWDRWQHDTAPYRAALKAKVDALKLPGSARPIYLEALEGSNYFPLFEIAPVEYIKYLYDSTSLEGFRSDRSVVAAHRWLRERGIDLIFVPVPKMTEVYIDHFLDPCPADRIIAPHIRSTLLELLNADVEVVDGLPLFRSQRDTDSEYLYNAADTHWAPRAMRIMAREVADRVGRYQFEAKARAAAPIVKTVPGPYNVAGPDHGDGPGIQNGWLALNAEQKKRATAALTKSHPHVTLPDGRLPPDDPASPVILIGNSYVANFREVLIQELNLLIRTNTAGGQTTESFADFLREPELLNNCRVVVWITTCQHLPEFKQLPPGIAATRSK